MTIPAKLVRPMNSVYAVLNDIYLLTPPCIKLVIRLLIEGYSLYIYNDMISVVVDVSADSVHFNYRGQEGKVTAYYGVVLLRFRCTNGGRSVFFRTMIMHKASWKLVGQCGQSKSKLDSVQISFPSRIDFVKHRKHRCIDLRGSCLYL